MNIHELLESRSVVGLEKAELHRKIPGGPRDVLTCLWFSSESPQLAVHKNKRHKRLSGKTRWNLMQSVRRLAAVFLLEATVFMSVCNTWGGAWMQQMYGTIRPDVFEVFGGHAEVS